MSPVSRRDALVLAAMLGAGGAALIAVRTTRPVGIVLEPSPVLDAAWAEQRPETGPADADLKLLVFTDYNCGACRMAHPDMMAAARADGRVSIRFFDWPIFGDDSRAAALGALAAARQGLYLPVHSGLMAGGRADGQSAEAALEAAGGNVAAYREALAQRSPEFEGQLARNAFHAFALGLGGTPGHLIGRVLVRGAVPERGFRRAFEQARALNR
jgi:protein-disulfide isomerase